MKFNRIFSTLALFAGLLSFTACNNDDDADSQDLMAPTFEISEFDASVDASQPDAEIHFEGQFSDDKALGQYKIDIHDAFDGHDHGRTAATAFTYDKVFELTGKQYTAHEHVEIPADAATGPYHFHIQFFDAAGNEGEIFAADLEIVNPTTQPAAVLNDDHYDVTPGSMLEFSADITDPDNNIEEIVLEIAEHHEDHDHGRTSDEGAFYEEDIDGVNAQSYKLERNIEIPADLEKGEYEIRLVVKDVSGNYLITEAEMHVE